MFGEKEMSMIELTGEQLNQILEWRDVNKDIVRNFLPFLTEGKITISIQKYFDTIFDFSVSEIEESKDYSIVCFVMFKIKNNIENIAMLNIKTNNKDGKCSTFISRLSDYDKHYTKEQKDAFAQDCIGCFFAINAYFFHYRQDLSDIPVKEVKKHAATSKNGKKYQKNIRYLTIKYRLKGQIRKNRIPKAKQWHVDCWQVTGHIRHYKSGKSIFIKPYYKGKERQKMISEKVYKV